VKLVIACVLLLATASPAAASPHLLVGVTEDGLKFEPDVTRRDATAVGLGAVRITLAWRPGLTGPSAEQRAELHRATGGAGPLRIVLSVFGERAANAPQTAAARDEYCDFLRRIVARYPRIGDIVVWNEPNKSFFWQPQFAANGASAAPRAYEALLARCWDVLHAERADVNVLGPSTAPRGNDRAGAASNVSHSPMRFLQELGEAYRASGRERPILDTVAHHVHGVSPAERPWRPHAGTTITEGDYERLVATLHRAFSGTAQPVPGRCVGGRCVPIWYLEAGFQTTPDRAKARFYTGQEVGGAGVPDAAGPVDLSPLPAATSDAPDQASQLVAAIRVAYCQPYVEGFFNFLLWDEHRLEGWQSGLYWADRTPKDSAAGFRAAIEDARAGRISCSSLRRQLPDPAAVLGPASRQATTPPPPTPASTTMPTTTPTPTPTTGSSAAPPVSTAAGKDDGTLDARLIAAGAGALALLGALAIAVRRRRSRIARNSR
jgi:hypothetical protein